MSTLRKTAVPTWMFLRSLWAVVLFACAPAWCQDLGAQSSGDTNLGNVLNNNGMNQNGNTGNPNNDNGGASQYYPMQMNGNYPLNSQHGANLQPTPDYNFSQNRYSNSDELTRQAFRILPPDPPTEFQKMVASSTGKMLPIFGASLFRQAPSTFAPLDRVPVTPDYLVGPGDELLIQTWGQVTLNSHFTVDRAGDIYIPQVGTFRVAGLSFGQLREFLKAQVGRNFRNFDLNVNMGQLRSIQVFLVGQVRRPGSYTVSSLSTLVDALFVTGGPNPQGSLRHIQVKREGKVITDFDLYDLILHGDKTRDIPLLSGDVIYVPRIGPQVAIAGSVNSPAIYELLKPNASTLGELLDLANGETSTASHDVVRLERVDESHLMRTVDNFPLDSQSRDRQLRDGDILELVSIVDRFKNGVTLRGNVANPGHYAWHSGMRVHELFPDKNALITRDYWLKQGHLGKPVLSYVPVCPPSSSARWMTNQGSRTNGSQAANQYGTNASTDYPNRTDGDPETSNNLRVDGAQSEAERQQEDSGGCVTLPESYRDFNQNSNTANQTNVQGGFASNNNGQDQNRTQDETQRNISRTSAASTAAALSDRSGEQFAPRNEVKLSEPDIDWSYAVIERQNKENLTTYLVSFNLGQLVLENDASQDRALEPGDVVTIFSKADIRVPQRQQTRFVHLEGEFLSSGVYSVQPGETLQDLVRRAGGFTSEAYLYGSEFTRESTRRVQQQRLNEYVDRIALQATTNSANNASRAVSALDTAAAAAMASQSQGVIENLRQLKATGRIVLELAPDSHSLEDLPKIPLEDGDRFIVPHYPSTVSVGGAVYNPNSFVYDKQRRLKDYLRLAGGSNRDADWKSVYVIRADGSVVSRRQVSSFRKDTFDALRIYPGDTVVVPINLSKGATLRNVVDIAQIVGQFGVAIAAANLVF